MNRNGKEQEVKRNLRVLNEYLDCSSTKGLNPVLPVMLHASYLARIEKGPDG